MQLHTILRAVAFACLLVSFQAAMAGQPEQGITLSVTRERLEKVFKEIEGQVNVSFIYSRETLSRSRPVTINVKNEQLDRLLQMLFHAQPMTYSVDGAFVIIRANTEKTDTLPSIASFRARLINQAGAAIAGATINIKGTTNSITSDNNGEFILRNLTPGTILLITGAELEPTELRPGNETFMTVTLKPKVNELDQVLVMAYGETTRRLNTGSIGKVSAAEIQRQPVSNPLAALHGRVPGVVVTQSSGVPGAYVKIQIRGQNSITQGSDPLFVIDGIPFGPNNNIVSQINSVAGNGSEPNRGALSPMSSINPSDIESIEILKDADATSIYGSRGANGVVLITTKKSRANRTEVGINAYSGFNTLTRTIPLLNTEQYVMMRKEAFANDGVAITSINAPDLILWDTTRYTDLKNVLTGNTATINDIQAYVSGGNVNNRFSLRSGFHRETTVFPGDMFNRRGSAHFSFNHLSTDQKFTMQFNASYASDFSNLIGDNNFATRVVLRPNLPSLFDNEGKLVWQENGVDFQNPLGTLFQEYYSSTNTLYTNTAISYRLPAGFLLKASLGYNTVQVNEQSTSPRISRNPASTVQSSSEKSENNVVSWNIEPQLEWTRKFDLLKITVLTGATLQKNINEGIYLSGSGYATDALIKDIQSASSVRARNSKTEYRYQAAFGRINLNMADKYLLNLSGRRDGSTRFGPDNRYVNFGAIGAAWIFTSERFTRGLSFLSFGKLRASYGTTGNDQIGDYQYYDTWSAAPNGYQGNLALRTTRLFNPDYSWEVNKKVEAALEVGFLKDRIFLTAAVFRNTSGNQLINYNLPIQTGFSSVIRNFPAKIRNEGLELSVSAKLIEATKFSWQISGNLSLPRNELLAFPGFAASSYSSTLQIGKPLSGIRVFQYLGVDPQTGVYKFNDINRDGQLTNADFVYLGSRLPKYTGGIGQTVSYQNFHLDIFFNFSRQFGPNQFYAFATPNGGSSNRPIDILRRWQKPGDITDVQRFTTTASTDAYQTLTNFNASSGVYEDISYWRLKNFAISYDLPLIFTSKLKASLFRVFIQAQNILTFTSYSGADPENQAVESTLPLVKTFTGGLQITF